MQLFRNVGMIFGLIVLVAGAGIFGFWYRDLFDPQMSNSNTQYYAPQDIQVPQTIPTQTEVLTTPSQAVVTKEKPQEEAGEPLTDDNTESGRTPKIFPVRAPSPATSISPKPEGKFSQSTRTAPAAANNADSLPSVPQTSKPPVSIKDPAPAKEGSTRLPSAPPKNVPLPTAETTNLIPKNTPSVQKPVTLTSTNQSSFPKTTPTQSVPAPAETSEELTDEEIDELIRELDEPDDELQLLSDP